MICYVTDKEDKKFEEYVERHGHFMQSLMWARFKDNLRHFAVYVTRDGEVCGAMSLFFYPEKYFKTGVLYCPRGPVYSDAESLRLLSGEAEKIAREIGAYEVVCDPDISDATDFISCGLSVGDNRDNAILQPFAVYRIDVTKTDEELMESFHSKARYSLRCALKSGAVCGVADTSELPEFCRLLAETASRDGFTARPLEYFEKMAQALGEEHFKLFTVRLDGKCIAGSVLIKYGSSSWHMYAGSDDDAKAYAPNFLMQWEMIRYSRDAGCKMYDMRGVAGQGDKLAHLEGLERFKKRFGGSLYEFVGRLEKVTLPRKKSLIKLAKKIKRSFK